MRTYCGFCSLLVAPKDPQTVKKGDNVYHTHCWQKKLTRDFEYQRSEVMQLELESNLMLPDLPFRFD